MIGRFTRAVVAVTAFGTLAATAACGVESGDGESCGESGGERGKSKALKVGWSTIYLTPSWMQQTDKMIKDEVTRLKGDGTIAGYQVFNANGDTSQQIAQIRAMIQQRYDVILVDAGSSTALNPAMEQAVAAGITVVNFDSLVTSGKVVRVGTDQKEWGRMMGQWLGGELGGKGKIIAFNGPAGVAVSEERWQGAQEALKRFPGIKVAANVHSEYNLAPAAQAFASAYSANPDIDGVFSQGGALSAAALQTLVKQKKKLVPITGENYNGFLKLWKEHKADGFSSLSTAQPNYLGVIALRAAVAKAGGATVPNQIMVPLPKITDGNLDQYVKPGQPDDSYPIQELPGPEIDKLIGE